MGDVTLGPRVFYFTTYDIKFIRTGVMASSEQTPQNQRKFPAPKKKEEIN